MTSTFVPTIKRVTSASAEASIKRGKKLLADKRFDEALSEFEALVRQDQASAFVHLAIGRIKYRQRDHDSALRHFKQAIELDPTQVQPYLRSGRIYLQRNELDKAREAFNNALRVNARSAIAYAAMGLVHLRQEHPDQAIEQWKIALSYNPRMILVRKRMATVLHKMGRSTDAIAQIKAALRIKPDDAESFAIKGRLHLLDKDYEEAQQAYEQAAELDPEDQKPLIRLGLAESYIEGQQLDKAERVLGEIPQREQFSALLHKLWGDLYEAKGLHKEALEEYRSAALVTGEDFGLEGLDSLDILADDSDDERWEGLAVAAKHSTSGFIEKRRQLQDSKT